MKIKSHINNNSLPEKAAENNIGNYYIEVATKDGFFGSEGKIDYKEYRRLIYSLVTSAHLDEDILPYFASYNADRNICDQEVSEVNPLPSIRS